MESKKMAITKLGTTALELAVQASGPAYRVGSRIGEVQRKREKVREKEKKKDEELAAAQSKRHENL